MSDLGRGDASQKLSRFSLFLKPTYVADQLVKVREGRPLGRSLQRVEGAPPELIALQQCVQLLALLIG